MVKELNNCFLVQLSLWALELSDPAADLPNSTGRILLSLGTRFHDAFLEGGLAGAGVG